MILDTTTSVKREGVSARESWFVLLRTFSNDKARWWWHLLAALRVIRAWWRPLRRLKIIRARVPPPGGWQPAVHLDSRTRRRRDLFVI